MAYTITISTNAQFVNDTDQLQLVMVFTVNDLTAANESYSAITKGIRVEDWGKLQWKYDIEDALLVPSSLGMVLTDAEGYLSSLFFGTSEANIKTDKRAQIQLWMNGALKFQGKIIEDSISYSDAHLRLEFTAATDMDIINQAMLYNLDNSPVNPFAYDSALKYAVWEYWKIYSSLQVRISATAEGRLKFIMDGISGGRTVQRLMTGYLILILRIYSWM
jgi:hypothetical protein